jgi:hypothetical protein
MRYQNIMYLYLLLYGMYIQLITDNEKYAEVPCSEYLICNVSNVEKVKL